MLTLSLNLKSGNFTSFGRLRQRILLKCVLHVQHDYFSSCNQSDHCFLAFSSPLLTSLLNRELLSSLLSKDCLKVAITATADKTSLKNKHLRNGDFFAIVAIFSHSLLLIKYATGGPVGAP